MSTESPPSATDAFVQAFMMILVSEVGDKTFLIAAILAMRHARLTVFAGAFGSLVVMSILSAALGHLLPTLIPKRWTQAAAAVLFFVFAAKMVREGIAMRDGNAHMEEEMKEAQEEIEEAEAAADPGSIPLASAEAGQFTASRPASPVARVSSWLDGARNLSSLVFGPVFVQAFVLTFLGEWGDRSQIATIALAAAHNVYLVTLGTIIGHSICTAVAVVAGRYVASKVSAKHVTLGGAALFFIFGLFYLYTASQPTNVDLIEDHTGSV
ncbi:UPF0016-domain-containing protein [Peniophora sp. CONT]|nr:UPF0016-domain-containing protein [Peniophora sp. CONT]